MNNVNPERSPLPSDPNQFIDRVFGPEPVSSPEAQFKALMRRLSLAELDPMLDDGIDAPRVSEESGHPARDYDDESAAAN